MHFNAKSWLRLAALTGLLAGCAADPDEYNGSCTLSCSNPRVGSAQYLIESMLPTEDGIALPCVAANGDVPHNGPIRVQYRIYEVRSRFGYPDSHLPAGGGGGGEDEGAQLLGGAMALLQEEEEADNPLKEPILSPLMKGGIGFEPVVYGAMAVDKTNEEHKEGNVATPFRFAGIVTPSSEWCSDSCGVMTYEFWPTCIAGGTNTIQAGVAVHGTKSSEYTEFALTDR